MNENKKIAYNSIINYAYFFTNAICNFLLNPIIIASLGPSIFGIWKLALRLFELGKFSDGRVSQALKWLVAKNVQNEDELGAIVSNAYKLWLKSLPLSCLTFALLVLFFIFTVDINKKEISYYFLLAIILASNFIIIQFWEIPDAIFIGKTIGYKTKIIQLIWLIFQNLGFYIFLSTGFGLIYLGLVTLICTLASSIHISIYVYSKLKININLTELKNTPESELKTFKSWVQKWSIIEVLLLSKEMILIAIFINLNTVASYSITAFLLQFLLAFCLLIGSSFTPQISKSINQLKHHSATSIIHKFNIFFYTVVILGSVYILLFNKYFISLWVDTNLYLGDMNNFLLLLITIQLIFIRSGAQFNDLTLDIKNRVKNACISIISCFLLVTVLFEFFPMLETILLSILISRIPLLISIQEQNSKVYKKFGLSSKFTYVVFIIITMTGYISLSYPDFLNINSWLSLVFTTLSFAMIFVVSLFVSLKFTNPRLTDYE